jgi:D-alanyl-D-alanine carboxypeptidase (penicillin-binding protein 5/6)
VNVVLRAAPAALVLAVLAAAPAAAAREPEGSGASAIVIDAGSGESLYEKDPDERRAIASTTKMMTALVVLEEAELDEVFTSPGYKGIAAESTLGLEKGERMRVEDLLTSLLLASANDAAATLADGVAGSQAKFVELMNRRARRLGLRDTRYANPIGLDDPDNYSTARDLATVATALMGHEELARIVGMPSATLESGAEPRTVENRNPLVSSRLVDGVKTGYTIEAGNVLVGSAEKHGARVISAVLGEPTEADRDADTMALLRYGAGSFIPYEAVAPGQELAQAAVRLADGKVPLVAARAVELTIRKGDEAAVDVRVDAPPVLEGPLAAGTRVGGAKVLYDGEEAGKTVVETGAEVPGPALTERAQIAIERNWPWLLLAGAGIVLLALLIRFRMRKKRGVRTRR